MPKFARIDLIKSRATAVRLVGVLSEVRTAALGGWAGIQAGIWTIRGLCELHYVSPESVLCQKCHTNVRGLILKRYVAVHSFVNQ